MIALQQISVSARFQWAAKLLLFPSHKGQHGIIHPFPMRTGNMSYTIVFSMPNEIYVLPIMAIIKDGKGHQMGEQALSSSAECPEQMY